MSKKNKKAENDAENKEQITSAETNKEETIVEETPVSETDTLRKEIEDLKAQLEHEKNEHLFSRAEFDNFRKRTISEKAELIKTAGESAMKGVLPIIDDFERGLAAMKEATDGDALREGIELIYNKFIKYLEQNGVKAIDSTGADFDTEFHEAVAMVPMGDDSQKGKIIDTIEKGYTLNNKVIRYAKVAVAQ